MSGRLRNGTFLLMVLLFTAGCEPLFALLETESVRRSLEPEFIVNNELDEVLVDKGFGHWGVVAGPIPRESVDRLRELFPRGTKTADIEKYFLNIGGTCFPSDENTHTICRYCKTKIFRSQYYLRRFYSLRETVWQIEIYPTPSGVSKTEDGRARGALALRMGLSGAGFPPDWDYTKAAQGCGRALRVLEREHFARQKWVY